MHLLGRRHCLKSQGRGMFLQSFACISTAAISCVLATALCVGAVLSILVHCHRKPVLRRWHQGLVLHCPMACHSLCQQNEMLLYVPGTGKDLHSTCKAAWVLMYCCPACLQTALRTQSRTAFMQRSCLAAQEHMS